MTATFDWRGKITHRPQKIHRMYRFVRPLLFRLDPERAHTLSMWTARLAQAISLTPIESLFEYEDETLGQSIWGLDFPNPIGLAAGFDKNVRLVPFWEAVGFGFVEVGSVSAQPSAGNPRPRAFRLPEDEALINRMGLNNQGAAAIARRLQQFERRRTRPLGINIVKTHDPSIMDAEALEDFRGSFRALAPRADYMALNISCPNTKEGKTFEAPDALDDLLDVIFTERAALDLNVPILLKLAPPMSAQVIFDSQVEDIVAVAEEYGVHGFIAANTASDRNGLATDAETLDAIGPGGLSGPPLAERSTRLVRYLYQKTNGAVPIVGVGGVNSAAAAYDKIRAGASLVQLYTGLVYEGPGLVQRIKKGLVERLARDGFAAIQEAVGVSV